MQCQEPQVTWNEQQIHKLYETTCMTLQKQTHALFKNHKRIKLKTPVVDDICIKIFNAKTQNQG